MSDLQAKVYVGNIESVDFKAFKFTLDCGGNKYEFACDPIEMIFLIEPVWDSHPLVRVEGVRHAQDSMIRFRSICAIEGWQSFVAPTSTFHMASADDDPVAVDHPNAADANIH